MKRRQTYHAQGAAVIRLAHPHAKYYNGLANRPQSRTALQELIIHYNADLGLSVQDASSPGSVPKLQATAEEEALEAAADFQSTVFRASVGSSVDSESESDGGEDVPSTWETITEHAPFTKHPSADDIPYIGADAQSESEEDNAPSQGNLAETNTNQSNNVLLTAQFLRTPLRCHRPLPVIRVLQARPALSSSTDRCPQFV